MHPMAANVNEGTDAQATEADVLDAVAAVVFVMTEGSVLGTACVRTGFGPLSRRPPTTKLAPHAAMNVGLT
jgi:hypothetical protein